MNQTVQTETISLKLINSKTYRKLYPYLVGAFLGSYFLSAYIGFPAWVVITLIFMNLVVILIFSVYAKNFHQEGILSLDEKNVVISQNNKQPAIFPIAYLKDFKISRGATVHHTDDTMYPAETHDNWISFTFNGQPYHLEFCIVNEEENEHFERVIHYLHKNYPEFYFESI